MPEPPPAHASMSHAIIETLSVHLGRHVAAMAVKAFGKKVGVPTPEQLTIAHVPGLIEEIRPMLNVMIGKGPSQIVVADIERVAAR